MYFYGTFCDDIPIADRIAADMYFETLKVYPISDARLKNPFIMEVDSHEHQNKFR